MFIRKKRIKGSDYAYLVKNVWTKKGSRQKSRKYLGRVIKPEKIHEKSFYEHHNITDKDFYFKNSSMKKIFLDLVKLELNRHGFDDNRKGVCESDKLTADLKSLMVFSEKESRKITLEMNEGFMCEYSLKKLLSFYAKTDDDKKLAYDLANTLVEAGINVEKDVFVEIYQKMTGFILT